MDIEVGHIIANGVWGTSGLSGGDNIFVNLIKFLQRSGYRFEVYTWEDGAELYRSKELKEDSLHLWAVGKLRFLGFPALYLIRTLIGCRRAIEINWAGTSDRGFVYSASDFWPDALPACLMSRRLRLPWVAAFYLFAPFPFSKKSPYRGKRWLVGFFYWLLQQPVYWLIKKEADCVLVTSEPDVERFITPERGNSRVFVIKGGVDISESDQYWNSGQVIPVIERRYDGCFVGRFHHQKGVLELIDIWHIVCSRRPQAKLALIGLDSLEGEIRQRIRNKNLENNIELLGPLSGEPKYAVFKQAKLVLHPATYDSGGMAAAEAMAWGLPGVSFDLESLKTYYPKGMVKTPCFDLPMFADNILRLLGDPVYYERLSKEARDLVREEWDWNRRFELLMERIKNG